MEELGFDPKKGLMGMMPHLAAQMKPGKSGEDTEDAGDPSEASSDDK